jgi:DNA repair exonuclease SbcCD ATPase subunit
VPVTVNKVYLRNFGTVRESELTLPPSGLCLIVGHNRTTVKVESVGSGKTLLGEAISRTLLGVPGRFQNFGSYSSDFNNNKNMMVKLDCSLDGKPLTIWHGYKSKELSATGSGLRFQFNGSSAIEHGDIDDTRRELASLIGVPSFLARYTIHVDGQRLEFNQLPERELVDLFMSVTSVGRWEHAQKRVNKAINQTRSEQIELETTIRVFEQTISSAEAAIERVNAKITSTAKEIEEQRSAQQARIDKAKISINTIKDRQKEIDEDKKAIKVKLKKLEDAKAEQFAKMELEVRRAYSEVSTISLEVEDATKEESAANALVTEAKKSLQSLVEPDYCPTCKKLWDKKHSASLLEERKTKLSDLEKDAKAKSSTLASIRERRQKARDAHTVLQNKLRDQGADVETRKLSDEYEDLEDEQKSLVSDLERANQRLVQVQQPIDDSALIGLRADVISQAKRKEEAKESIVEHRAKLAEVNAYIHILEYLSSAFSPTGVPNMVLNDCLSFTNKTSAHLSNLLTGGLIEITLDAVKQLSSGNEKPSLNINVKNKVGAKKFGGSSKGEAGVSNLIISETLYSLGRLWQKVGYRWLDEAVNSQDPTVRGSVYSYFRDQAVKDKILTCVVDHSADVEKHADHVIITHKSPTGETTYRLN